jgi:hypothetical protein
MLASSFYVSNTSVSTSHTSIIHINFNSEGSVDRNYVNQIGVEEGGAE